MLSLLLTLFISLFSLGSSYYQLEEHVENNVVINESKPLQNLGYYDSGNGIELYMFKSDFCSNEFIITFVNALSQSNPNWGYDNDTILNYAWYNNSSNPEYGITDYVYSASYTDLGSSYAAVRAINFNKYYADTTNNLYKYQLVFYNQSWGVILQIDYFIATFGTITDNKTGFTCTYFLDVVDPVVAGWDTFCIYENTSTSQVCPLVNYYYDPMYINNVNYNEGFADGKSLGFQDGYSRGYSDGTNVDATASTIFTGILDVALIPVNVFLTIFNFELFGINIGGIVSGLLTLSVVIIILRFLFGGKKDD